MLLSQLVQHVCCVEAGVITQLAGDDLQCLGIGADEQLGFASNRSGMIPEMPALCHVQSSIMTRIVTDAKELGKQC